MERLKFVFFALSVLFISFLLIPFNPTNLSAKNVTAGHEKAQTETIEEVPFDRPVEEIVKYLAPQNELTLFPCSECHDEDWEVNSERRELEEPHDETPGKFVNHDSKNRWCLDCHSAKNRDKLRLINGKRVDFKEYYKLCAQCHRKIYRQWKMGIHGKRTGYWNGTKQYWNCTQCHNPHNPPFKPLEPMPPPRKPKDIRVKVEEGK